MTIEQGQLLIDLTKLIFYSQLGFNFVYLFYFLKPRWKK